MGILVFHIIISFYMLQLYMYIALILDITFFKRRMIPSSIYINQLYNNVKSDLSFKLT